MCSAIEKAMAYWNKHRHPSVWGRHSAATGRAAGRGSRLPGVSDNLPDEPLSSTDKLVLFQ